MRFKVDVEGQTMDVELREGTQGTEARVGDEAEFVPVRLVSLGAPRHLLELGQERHSLLLGPDAEDPQAARVGLRGRLPLTVTAVDARLQAIGRPGGGSGRKKKVVKSPMPGLILEVRVEVGQEVETGHVLCILEAMKMQNEIRAEAPGKVKALGMEVGASVAAGAKLVEFE
jgi:propionyl-CoA carboxylase alpha subunit